MDEQQTIKVKAKDILPCRYAYLRRITETTTVMIAIIGRQWSEDGETITMWLEHSNSILGFGEKPDAEVDVVPLPAGYRYKCQWYEKPVYTVTPEHLADLDAKDAIDMAKRPPRKVDCTHCGGSGKVEVRRGDGE